MGRDAYSSGRNCHWDIWVTNTEPSPGLSLGVFVLLSNTERCSQDCTSQCKIGHVHPQPASLSADTVNATKSQSYILECNRWGCRPKKEEGAGFEPPEIKLPIKSLRFIRIYILCSSKTSVFRKSDLWFREELNSIQILYFTGHESSIKILKILLQNAFLLNQELPMKQNKTTAQHFYPTVMRQLETGCSQGHRCSWSCGRPQGPGVFLPCMALSWVYNRVLASNLYRFMSGKPSCLRHPILTRMSSIWGKYQELRK